MGVAVKQTEDEFDKVADRIAKLYDNAEKLLQVAASEAVIDNEGFISRIETVVNQIEESANTISEDFADVVEKGEVPTNAMKRRVNSALRKILLAVEEFRQEVNEKGNRSNMSAAYALVEKWALDIMEETESDTGDLADVLPIFGFDSVNKSSHQELLNRRGRSGQGYAKV